MKTQRLFLFFAFVVSMISYTSKVSATIHYANLDTTNTNETHSICGDVNDSLIVYKPDNALTGIIWFTPGGSMILNQDSVIITHADQGTWGFYSDQVWKNFQVYISLLQPYEPVCMQTDTNFCNTVFSYQLNAQNTETGCTYLWDDGSTNQTRTVNAPGIYWVENTNNCGTRRDSIVITQINLNAPHLGNDTTFCYGNSMTLDPGNSDILSYYWSTDVYTPTITVDTTGSYWVYTQDINGCLGRDTINVTTIQTPSQEILLATINTDPIDPNYGNNKMTWEVNPLLIGIITTVNIYRESGTNNYVLVGTANYEDGEWTDVVNSNAHSWKYKISLVGSPCGEGYLSESVQTIHCWISYDPINHVYTIQWDPYLVGDGTKATNVTWYKVLSGNGMSQLAIRDSVSGTVTSVTLPNTTDSIFLVGAELNGAKSIVGLALSNRTSNPTITGIDQYSQVIFELYPNPATDQINIVVGYNEFQIEVSTMLGQVLLTEQNTKVLNISSLPPGIYLMSIATNGIKNNRMFTKQ